MERKKSVNKDIFRTNDSVTKVKVIAVSDKKLERKAEKELSKLTKRSNSKKKW